MIINQVQNWVRTLGKMIRFLKSWQHFQVAESMADAKD